MNFFSNFRALFSNSASAITSFVNQAIAMTNVGYANSRVPITMTLHCIIDSSITSVTSFSTMIKSFTPSASKLKEQLQTLNIKFFNLKK
jgi:hypothetical protein